MQQGHVWHETAHWTDESDRARRVRDQLTSLVPRVPDTILTGASDEILSAPTVPEPIKDWLRAEFDQMAERLAEPAPWRVRDILAFEERLEIAVRADVDLFDLALDRLVHIKNRMERGNFSNRQLFVPKMPEKPIQLWLADQLELLANGQYSVHREEEVDLSKEPDVRLHASGAGYVSIEVKPLDDHRYTFKELVEALETQLVGQYLRAEESRYGILALFLLKTRR